MNIYNHKQSSVWQALLHFIYDPLNAASPRVHGRAPVIDANIGVGFWVTGGADVVPQTCRGRGRRHHCYKDSERKAAAS